MIVGDYGIEWGGEVVVVERVRGIDVAECEGDVVRCV